MWMWPVAKQIIRDSFDEFTKKHYHKILKKLGTEDEEFVRDAIALIVKLNPKPGGSVSSGMAKNQYVILISS